MYIYIYICICIYTYVCVYVNIKNSKVHPESLYQSLTFVYILIYVCIYLCIYIYICIYIYVYVYGCMYSLKTAKFIPNLLGLAVAERKKTQVIQHEWRQAKHLAALHEVPKEPYIQSKETCILSKKTYILSKDSPTQVIQHEWRQAKHLAAYGKRALCSLKTLTKPLYFIERAVCPL